ncbi:MAG: hypothetical protein A2487_04990 [Candidatus Raymondbacteria bacterium RifOxyC12_full_50_8]|uniref:Lipid A biosynthesis acyltransferase n=1 Tax=Candidatus Raymondbacteria bacterium RIFOXYD12_FULL_49_13 TaxID=1817890 RepID=A0A1F7FHQ2_UNCRA|nr:MAG: hypothetical protein A2248_22295 [Candidatus Raymondbacteria bacterium RIFOXYA2_FULL_49_16]OGJ94015.1 MAG: hypothetical protein A2350_19625 [Candidatus Raymondbacteria bacterium RifOxyB12_full_50_8]OGK00113.1 MAG: hypothetical protein A2487_04990 [Candidatus Raymondbacteria bacterium RifOxyC12_full_50_8]OGK06153.1 MAG: hypothetical protein A2519_22745 [Candidatus Raymondbacteria bacterium RIFOXYD12_FULL_49_13]OGP42831.1 MAG: hypothetical protein A2324_16110 [Candidatus Raymondbacteria b
MYIFHHYTSMKAVLLLGRLVRAMPCFLVSAMAVMLGNLIYFCVPYRKSVILQQMTKCLGNTLDNNEIRKLARLNYVHYGHVLFESLLLASFGKGETDYFEEHFTISGKEELLQALAQGKGVVLIGGHMGFWEAFGHWLVRYASPVTVPVKFIHNHFVQKLREQMQAHPAITLVDSRMERQRSVVVIRALKKGEVAGLFIDQYRPSEEFAPFFGHDARTNSTAAILARRTNAAIIYTYIVRKRFGSYQMHFQRVHLPDADGKGGAAQANALFNRLLEETIRTYPDQWFWAHRRFKENPEFTY